MSVDDIEMMSFDLLVLLLDPTWQMGHYYSTSTRPYHNALLRVKGIVIQFRPVHIFIPPMAREEERGTTFCRKNPLFVPCSFE